MSWYQGVDSSSSNMIISEMAEVMNLKTASSIVTDKRSYHDEHWTMHHWGCELDAFTAPFKNQMTNFYILYRIEKLWSSLYGRDHVAPGIH